jgi:SOS-response transcriptional repressor LexA
VTERQQQVLQTIIDFRAQHGYSPTVREIGQLLGITSPNGMMCHLRRLRQLRKITWADGATRSIVPVQKGVAIAVNVSNSQFTKLSKLAKQHGMTVGDYCAALIEPSG